MNRLLSKKLLILLLFLSPLFLKAQCEGVSIFSDGSGGWPYEVSWSILDCEGELIAEGGSPADQCIDLPDMYLVEMSDSYGDGWNGNSLTIGTESYSLESGFSNVLNVGCIILGCTDSEAFNYDENSVIDDGSCDYSSQLPIIRINTIGQEILDDPRIFCNMGIIDNGYGNLNYLDDPFNNYDGQISIEIRGSSSQSFPKKSYAFETQDVDGNNNNVSLLNMPAENDWILYAPYSDKTLMRNFLTFDIGRKMNRYSSRTVFCNLVINGEYRGVYILMEKIKIDDNRVDIAQLDSDDTQGDSLTGGYIVKIDKYTGSGGEDWVSDFSDLGGGSTYMQYHDPEASEMEVEQRDYIKSYIDSFEYALAGPNFLDLEIGYNKYIDVNSFIDLYIINELSRNVDGYRLSTYMYKDRDSDDGKLTMGPFWDYNLAYGNAYYCDGWDTDGWQQDGECDDLGDNPFWFDRLLDDPEYQNKLKCRWDYLRATTLHEDTLFNFIDSVASYLDNAQQLNFQKWNILGNDVWPNYYVGETYQEEIEFFKNWIEDRLLWLDSNFPGDCEQAISLDIVINEIMASNDNTMVDEFGEYDDWIEIYNKGSYPINLNNYHLSDNLSNLDKYTFPNILLGPYEYFIVWADDEEENQGDNHATFKLSASGEALYLSDSNFNLIDGFVFGTQQTDMGYARVPNGTGPFVIQSPTFANNNDLVYSQIEYNDSKKLIKSIDLLGRDIRIDSKHSIMLYIYDDGSVEKIYISH